MMFFGIFGWKKHRWTSKTDFQTLCWCFAEIFVSAAGMLVPAAEMLACGCRWGTSSKVTPARTLICPDASRQQYVEVCLATLLKITEILMNWCRTVARFIGLNSTIFGRFFCENTAYFKKNRIRFLHLRNFW